MRIAVAKEIEASERRVALITDYVSKQVKQSIEVSIESGAGEKALFNDSDYEAAGATIISDTAKLWGEADILLKVSPPQQREDGSAEIDLLKEGSVFIGFLNPLRDPSLIEQLAQRKVTAFSMEMIPRTTRAQSMDALSSQASIAGYKSVLIAAEALPKYFPMLTTAAGTIAPAKVFVMGAGVAGLQAIATARRLGAMVEAFDIRAAVKEEVQSLGAKFVEVKLDEETATAGGYAKEISEESKKKTQEAVNDRVKNADVVITTAQVPGRKAPRLVTEEMIAQMKPGAVIVDLAADQGGNAAYTEPGGNVVKNGVTIIGPVNLPSSVPVHASQLYSKNLVSLMKLLEKDSALNLDFEDDIVNAACVTHSGEIRNQRIKDALQALTVNS